MNSIYDSVNGVSYKNKNNVGLSWKFFLFRLVLWLRGIIVASPIMVPEKNSFPKSLYLNITYNEIVQNSKSEPKKILILVYL